MDSSSGGEEGVASQPTEITSIMDFDIAPQESEGQEPGVFTSGESFDSADVDSDDESSILPPPPDAEGSSIMNHPLNDNPHGYFAQSCVLPLSVHPTEIEPAPEPSKSQDAGSEEEIDVACMTPPLGRRDESGGSIKLDKCNSRFKTNINSRLSHAVRRVDFAELWRSPDLVPLTRKYQVFRKQLRHLIASIKAYKKTTEQMEEARSKVSQLKSLFLASWAAFSWNFALTTALISSYTENSWQCPKTRHSMIMLVNLWSLTDCT